MRKAMGFSLVVMAVAALLLVGGDRAAGQEPAEARALIQLFLRQDCGTGETLPSSVLSRIVALGAEAVPLLLAAVKEGPPAQERQGLEADARRDCGALKQYVAEGGLRELKDAEVLKAARAMDEATCVAMRVNGLARAWRERGINALAAIGVASTKALEELAASKDLEAELRDRAKEALEKVRTARPGPTPTRR